MKKKLLALLLCAALAGAMLPFSVPAAPAADAKLLDGATLVTLGDSLTAMGSWPSLVAEELNMVLVNSGIGGDTSADALARFERDVVKKNPDFVLIGLGTNDFVREGAGNTNPRVDLNTYRSNLQTMIDGVKALNAVPILITAPFVREGAYGPASNYDNAGGLNPALDAYIEVVRALAKENNIGLIDIHKLCDNYTLEEFLISDGVHLAKTGNRVYADAIEAYLTDHYRTDPDAPRVEQPKAPTVEEGVWTKDFISFKAEDWLILKEGTINITEEADGSISFSNTTGLWPEAHYSPALNKTIAVPVENSYLTIDFTTEAATNLVLFLNGSTPTVSYDQNYIPLAPLIKAAIPSLKQEEVGDISANQTVRCTLKLADFIPDNMISVDGTVLLSGLKVYVVGTAGKKITFREMSVTNPDPATVGHGPVYEDVVSFLPEEESRITPNQGIADYTINADGSLTLARAAEDTLSWPSVWLSVDKEVDLSEAPYLHLDFTCAGGCANGFLEYVPEDGVTRRVQLSQLVANTVNDFTSAQRVYINLAEKIGSTGKITLKRVELSVYGAPGDALTWRALAAAKLIKEAEEPAPEVSEPSDESADAPDESQAEASAGSQPENVSSAEEPSPAGDDSKGGLSLNIISAIIGVVAVAVAAVAGVIALSGRKKSK